MDHPTPTETTKAEATNLPNLLSMEESTERMIVKKLKLVKNPILRWSADTALDLGKIFSADVPAAPLIYTQYVSTSNQYKVSTSQGGGLQIHASISNVVALFVRQEHYRPLDLCRRVLLGLLDLRVVLAQDRRVLLRGDGDATLFTWAVWICCRSGDLHGGHCALEPVPRVCSCGFLLVRQLAGPAA